MKKKPGTQKVQAESGNAASPARRSAGTAKKASARVSGKGTPLHVPGKRTTTPGKGTAAISGKRTATTPGKGPAAPSRLSHVDAAGAVRMVDVGEKPESRRRAVAEATVFVGRMAARAVREDTVAKGNVLEIARIAGIQAAKRTHELIPLCHPLPLDHVHVECRLVGSEVRIVAEAAVFARTGVEMEAMTAVSVAALTVYDMLKAVEKGIEIRFVHLKEKTGGRGGRYSRPSRPGG